MADQTAPDILARLLDIQPDEAQRLLDRFAGGMTAELLDRSRLSVDGLGSFSVVHEQPVRESGTDGTRYLPPRNRVEFTPRAKGSGDTASIASARLDMESSEARRFAQALATTFGKLLANAGGFELRGFGSFTTVSGKFQLQPDSSLEALLNSAYEGLKTIVIPDRSDGAPESKAHEGSALLKPVALTLAVLLLLVGGWFLSRNVPSGSPEVVSASVSSTVVPVVEEKVEAPVQVEPPESDSLLLRKGRYTVIAATFSSKSGAMQERQRLAALGHRTWFWEVTSDGRRYYRLALGDFATRSAALDSMKSMPKGLPKHSYIQQAYKNFVLYGEQEL
ncbi:Sporulation domain protein [Chlorobaculum parvum NCIB 8327]|uniref:Sporulation domain protein n=1 Tax=Chlorobaculum parvum (strain DSM 263 / NCIMB 8327) TaxID=517417 RepID=B3QL10_CHLP8|nr:SPOR domain-containing protein [Chlorobaculum parvum]ACF10798.1 Sporulation domain protein [Chlorobaculum parvum NCIB 8327]